MNDYLRLLDAYKRMLGIDSEQKLADTLGLTKQKLSAVRSGRDELPVAQKFTLMDQLQMPWTRENVMSVLPPDARKKVGQISKSKLN